MNRVLLKKVRPFIDGQLQAVQTVLIEQGQLQLNPTIEDTGDLVTIDGNNCWLLPGAIDLGAHIPEPGFTQKGTVQSELRAAAAGGVTQVCSQPDCKPVADSTAVIQLILDKANIAEGAQLFPLGAMTPGLKGDQIANMVSLIDAGAIALSNARQPIKDSYVLKRLMEYAVTYGITLVLTANDPALSAEGHMHEGATATRLGLNGIPALAETVALAQILLLAEAIGTRIHVSQISCAESLTMLRQAKERGVNVTADTSLANLLFTDQMTMGYDSQYHVQPPLRSDADRQALLQAVKTGELAISSNHSPHDIAAKKAPFADAAVGMSMLDGFMNQVLSLIGQADLTLENLMFATSDLPGQVINLNNSLQQGSRLNGYLYDPEQTHQFAVDSILSGGRNHPYINKSLPGKVLATWSQGKCVFQDGLIA